MADLEISVDIDARGTKTGAAEVRRNIKSVADSSGDMATKLKSAGAMMQSFGGTLQSVGRTLAVAITIPVIGLGTAILKAGGEYEKSMNMFQAVTKASAEQMAAASQVAKNLGADLSLPATSAGDAAKAMTELGKAGLTANQAMDAAKGVLQLAAAGALEEARAAEVAANALNAFHLEAKETVRVADLLAAAANASSAEVEDIALAMQQAGSSFATAKMPIEDMVTAISALANAGIKGSDAGTSLKTFIQSLAAPSAAAAETMQKLGVAVFDASGKMNQLPEIIGKFQTALDGLTDEQRAAALYKIFGSDAIRAAQILFSTGTEGFATLKEAVTATGAAADLANSRTKGLSGAWEGFKSQMETIGISIYEVIKAPLTQFLQNAAQFAGEAGNAFSTLSPGIQQAVIAFAAFAAALGPVLIVVGAVVGAIATIVSTVGGAAAAVGGFAVLGPIIAAVVAGIAQLALVAGALYIAWQTNFGGIRELTEIVATAVDEAWAAALVAIEELTKDVMAEVHRFWQENGEQIMDGVNTVSDTIRQVWTAVVNFWLEHNGTIKEIAKTVWDAIKTLVTTAIRAVADVITIVLKAIKGDWSGAWKATEDLLSIVVKAWNTIVDAGIKVLLGLVKLMFEGIWALSKWVFDEATKLGVSIVQGIAGGIRDSAHFAINAARDLANVLPDWVRKVLNIQSPSKVMHDIGLFIAQGLAQGIAAGGAGVGAAADSLGKRILRSFKSMIGNLLQMLANGGTSSNSNSGMGPGGTPVFNGNAGSGLSGRGGGNDLLGRLQQILNGGGRFDGPRTGSIDEDGNYVVNGNDPGSMWSQLKTLFGRGEGGIFAPRKNILTGKMSKWGGILGGIGSIVSMIGGLIGGRVGGVLSSIGTGAQIGAMFGPIGAGIGAAIGAIVGIFGANKQRRKEEAIRNQGMLDAFEALKKYDTIIADVKGLRMDPAQGLAAGEQLGSQVRSQYLEMANSLKDKKTRNHALADVSRIDAIITQKMAELRVAVELATAAGERTKRILPEFANGVFLSPAFQAFRRYNGMLGGTFTGRDTIPAMLAQGEMVLNPRQQARVRANAGHDVFQGAGIPGYADGVAIGAASLGPGEPMVLQLNFEHSIDAEGMIRTTLKNSEKAQKQVRIVINDGFSNGLIDTSKRGA